MYEHINEYEWTSKGSIYRCLKERLGICWEIAGLSDGRAPELQYFCVTDKVREERDNFPFDTCFILGTDEMMRPEQGIFANDETYAELWPGYYIGLDRTAKKVICEDVDGILHGFSYEN